MERESEGRLDDEQLAALDRLRREVAALGTDAASAPDVPADVVARIVAALRSEPPPTTRPGGAAGTAGPTLVL